MIRCTQEKLREAVYAALPGPMRVRQEVVESFIERFCEELDLSYPSKIKPWGWGRDVGDDYEGQGGCTRQTVEEHEETLLFVLGELDALEGRVEAVEERLGEKPELYKTPTWMGVEGPRPPSYEEFMGHVTERLAELAKRLNELRRLV